MRQPFQSRQDTLARLWTRTTLEAAVLRAFHQPLAARRQADCPIYWMQRNDSEVFTRVKNASPDLILSAGFNRILPESLLHLARLGAFNCHPAPLPRYAGANPWFWMLRAGETSAAVTIHRMTVQVDAGDIVAQRAFPLGAGINHQQFYNQTSIASAQLLAQNIVTWSCGQIEETPQNLSQRTFYATPLEQDYEIDWRKSAHEIQNLVRAASPAPGAWTTIRGARIIVRRVRGLEDEQPRMLPPGSTAAVRPDGVAIRCGDGWVLIERISYAGKEWRRANIARQLHIVVGDACTAAMNDCYAGIEAGGQLANL